LDFGIELLFEVGEARLHVTLNQLLLPQSVPQGISLEDLGEVVHRFLEALAPGLLDELPPLLKSHRPQKPLLLNVLVVLDLPLDDLDLTVLMPDEDPVD